MEYKGKIFSKNFSKTAFYSLDSRYGAGTGTCQKSEPEPRGMMLIDVQDPMMESMEGSLRHHQLININGTQHIITSSKPLPDLKRLHNHHVEVRR
jgi:hypothetical protein